MVPGIGGNVLVDSQPRPRRLSMRIPVDPWSQGWPPRSALLPAPRGAGDGASLVGSPRPRARENMRACARAGAVKCVLPPPAGGRGTDRRARRRINRPIQRGRPAATAVDQSRSRSTGGASPRSHRARRSGGWCSGVRCPILTVNARFKSSGGSSPPPPHVPPGPRAATVGVSLATRSRTGLT